MTSLLLIHSSSISARLCSLTVRISRFLSLYGPPKRHQAGNAKPMRIQQQGKCRTQGSAFTVGLNFKMVSMIRRFHWDRGRPRPHCAAQLFLMMKDLHAPCGRGRPRSQQEVEHKNSELTHYGLVGGSVDKRKGCGLPCCSNRRFGLMDMRNKTKTTGSTLYPYHYWWALRGGRGRGGLFRWTT